jgi:NAD(P)-dependent dehydrogenase (short-subunit alcohol dehydrogenase family)
MMDSHFFHLTPEEAKKAKAEMEKLLPMNRLGHPDDIAGAAVYLASAASNYTTGAEIIIDGAVLLSTMNLAD